MRNQSVLLQLIFQISLLVSSQAWSLSLHNSRSGGRAAPVLLPQQLSRTMRNKCFIQTPVSTRLQAEDDSKVTVVAGGNSLFARINEFGLSLKPKAEEASQKSKEVDTEAGKSKRIMLSVKSSFMYFGYILYRAYRGFFVILPEVFKEVYRKMENAVDMTVFDEQDKSVNLTDLDINPKTGKTRWRTKVVTSMLASIITVAYVVTGAVKVAMMFVKTVTKTSSLKGSFEAAITEQETNEDRILRITQNSLNGQGRNFSPPSGGLAP